MLEFEFVTKSSINGLQCAVSYTPLRVLPDYWGGRRRPKSQLNTIPFELVFLRLSTVVCGCVLFTFSAETERSGRPENQPRTENLISINRCVRLFWRGRLVVLRDAERPFSFEKVLKQSQLSNLTLRPPRRSIALVGFSP